MLKRKLVEYFVASTDGWNHEFHEAIERRVMGEYKRLFPNGLQSAEETAQRIDQMRTFYYGRMVATATLLLAVASLLVSLVALVAAAIALI